MKVIDLSPIRPGDNPLQRLNAHLQGIMKYGYTWETELKAQETVVELLRNLLDNRYTLVRYVILEGLDIPIPLILVGPAGIFTIYVSGTKGVFRAKSEGWAELNRNTHKYEPARVNLITRTQLLTKAVDAYLTRRKRPHPPLQSALLLSDPGTHVDAVRPAVRVVLRDGIERFAGSLLQERQALAAEEIPGILETLTKGQQPVEKKAEAIVPERDAFSFQDTPPATSARPRSAAISGGKSRPGIGRLRFTTGQWLILGAIVAVWVLIMIAFVVFFLFFLP